MMSSVVGRVVLAMALAGVSSVGISAVTHAQPQHEVQGQDSPKQKKPSKAQGQEKAQEQQHQQNKQNKEEHGAQHQRQQGGQQENAQQQQQKQQDAQQQRKQDEQGQKAHEKQQREQQRLSEREQRQRIEEQRQRLTQYREHLDQQQRLAQQHAAMLKQQKRLEQYRFQEQYLERLREQQRQIQNARDYDYDADPYFHTAPIYRYSRAGRSYETNQYGADLLRKAVNYGYEEGFRAARADREDGWRSSYEDSYAYRDANYGYAGYYVDRDDYNHYFREGFRRGYEDGYQGRYEYGEYSDGNYSVLETVLNLILNLQPLR